VKPKCPHLRVIQGGDEEGYMCELEDKWCLVECGYECDIYNVFLEEVSDGTYK